ncbi:MAG: alpha-mannosidase [Lachnospiraceae bacterium]|nr:alpha-mannosidase [Lachnospiraceae bacterium]
MFFTEKKLEARIAELALHRYLDRKPIGNWKVKEDVSKEEKYPPGIDDSWEDFPVGSRWEGRDYYLWLVTEFTVPELGESDDFLLLFYFGKTGGGHNSGFESMLYIDDMPYQGVDSNHGEVFLDSSYSGQRLRLALKLWSGLEGGGVPQIMCHKFEYGDMAFLSKETDDLYYTSGVMLDTAAILDKNDPARVALLQVLEQTYNLLEWSVPGSVGFYNSVRLANDYLNKKVTEMPKYAPVTVTAIGHTHIDVAWLWRLKHTREKAARSFSTVLRLMERYPEYIFLQSQPQLYAYIKEDYPEIYEKIKEKVQAGVWEVDGAMWLEADCNLTSGESLVRQILHGSKFIKGEFGKEVKYLWLPDVFGYSWALPQILKKSGIDTFMTTKISWNQYNRLPHDTFWWRGIDGSEVLTHFITTPDGGLDEAGFSFYTYNGNLAPHTVKGIYDNYRDKTFNSELLLSYGYGDGGGGVNREMLEKRRRLDGMPGLPKVKTGRADAYFARLHETVEQAETYVHTWDGELYLEYHRGTYTSQAFVKKGNRKLELAYRDAELLHGWATKMRENWDYPAEKIYKGWEIILRNQFHDIIPGSSIHEVYEDLKEEYALAAERAVKLCTSFAEAYPSRVANKWTVFNTAAWRRDELVFVPEEEIVDMLQAGCFVTCDNVVLDSVRTSDGYQVYVKGIPPLSSLTFSYVERVREDDLVSPFAICENEIETPFYCIVWNDQGQLTSIFDKTAQREVLKEGGLGNYLRIFEDKPMQFDAWDIDLYYMQKYEDVLASKIEIQSQNGLSACIVFTYVFGQSKMLQEMIVYANSRRIDFKTNVDWQERQRLLRTFFDVDIRATEATYQIQFGNVKRLTHWNTSWDMARFESVAHQWVDFSERDYGVALLNDCKYGHTVKDQTMSMSLLKGAIAPDPMADIGKHEFTYSILPHRGDFVAGAVTQAAWALNRPLVLCQGDAGDEAFIKIAEVDFDEPVVAIDAIKQKESGEGLIIRMHEHTGSRRKLCLKPQFAFTVWQETNLMEKPIGEKQEEQEGKIFLELKPYEIKTILIR